MSVPLRLVLAQNERVVIAVIEVVAYSVGFEVSIGMRGREDLPAGGHFPRAGAGADEWFRFGVQFSDGRKGTNIAGPIAGHWTRVTAGQPGDRTLDAPSAVILISRGGGGGGRRYDQRYYVWPLPTLGKLTLACEWPAMSIPLSFAEVDSTLILDAAGQSQKLWED